VAVIENERGRFHLPFLFGAPVRVASLNNDNRCASSWRRRPSGMVSYLPETEKRTISFTIERDAVAGMCGLSSPEQWLLRNGSPFEPGRKSLDGLLGDCRADEQLMTNHSQ
jgi:hypothetical protein